MKKDSIQITTIIGSGAECGGNFSAEGSVRIDGKVNGDVTVTGALIVGAAGVINGNVSAQSALIGGEVIGNVKAPEKTELTSSARVIGDIMTAMIVIDEKAVFQGRCDMNQESPENRAKAPSKAVRAGRKTAKVAIAEALREAVAANDDAEDEFEEL